MLYRPGDLTLLSEADARPGGNKMSSEADVRPGSLTVLSEAVDGSASKLCNPRTRHALDNTEGASSLGVGRIRVSGAGSKT